jgi:hypothetical protein
LARILLILILSTVSSFCSLVLGIFEDDLVLIALILWYGYFSMALQR